VDRLYASFTGGAAARKADARVVVLSSTAHTMGSVHTDDLHYSKGRSYSAWGAYGQSKMANLLFAMSLEKRFRDDGFASTCTAVSVHPGVIKTNLWKNTAFSSNIVVSWFGDVFLMKKTIPQGAATSVYAALHADAARQDMRGAYLVDCAKGAPSGTSAELAKDLQLATNEQLKEKLSLLEN
jgi:NAD(P)-dependent dehydrogenase (short-subunit alcohol dehydrogenase family)